MGSLLLFLINYLYIYKFKEKRNIEFEQKIINKKIERKALYYINGYNFFIYFLLLSGKPVKFAF